MSAAKAREILTDLRNGRSPIVATGEEDGTVQIEYEYDGGGISFLSPETERTTRRLQLRNRPDLQHQFCD
jgi:hypothetical protein